MYVVLEENPCCINGVLTLDMQSTPNSCEVDVLSGRGVELIGCFSLAALQIHQSTVPLVLETRPALAILGQSLFP